MKINNSLQILKLEGKNINIFYRILTKILKDNFFDDESTLKEIETKLEKNQKAMTKIENSTISWNEIVLRKNELKVFFLNIVAFSNLKT